MISLDFVLGGPTEKFFVCYNVIQKFIKSFCASDEKDICYNDICYKDICYIANYRIHLNIRQEIGVQNYYMTE